MMYLRVGIFYNRLETARQNGKADGEMKALKEMRETIYKMINSIPPDEDTRRFAYQQPETITMYHNGEAPNRTSMQTVTFTRSQLVAICNLLRL
jgi:hypothetical protein